MNPAKLRIGQGYDVHRLVDGRPLVLGGESIPYPRGLDGHSDADVLLHALGDALLGAAGLGISASISRRPIRAGGAPRAATCWCGSWSWCAAPGFASCRAI